MPLYEYECPSCGVFEVEQRMTEQPLTSCPTHPGQAVRKLISRSSFALRGGGWYTQGYAGGKGGAEAQAAPPSKGASPSPAPTGTAGDSAPSLASTNTTSDSKT